MLPKEQHVEISVLIRQGLSIRAIARQMCCSRNTVRRHLKLQVVRQPLVYGPRVERASKQARMRCVRVGSESIEWLISPAEAIRLNFQFPVPHIPRPLVIKQTVLVLP